jgi:hypothetical protein
MRVAGKISKREFLKNLGLGAGLAGLTFSSQAQAQQAAPPAAATAGRGGGRGRRKSDVPHRTATVTNVFKSPEMYPNALAAMTDPPYGLWVGQQKLKGVQADRDHVAEQPGLDQCFLLDWSDGHLKKTLSSGSEVTSGLAYGDKCLWVVANNENDYPPPVTGVWQVDMNNKTVNVHQIPLGGGGSHGAKWHDGKLWVLANRLDAMLRIDTKTWVAEYAIPLVHDNDLLVGSHDFAFDDKGFLWIVMLNSGRGYANSIHSLAKYDPATGQLLEIASMPVGTGYAHGLEFYEGAFYGCDAGHPDTDSTNAGWIFRIDLA